MQVRAILDQTLGELMHGLGDRQHRLTQQPLTDRHTLQQLLNRAHLLYGTHLGHTAYHTTNRVRESECRSSE